MPADEVGNDAFGPWLRRQRRAAGLTQEELAARSGLSMRAISNLERGRSCRPHPHSVRLLARALDLPDGTGDDLVVRLRAGQGPPAPPAAGPVPTGVVPRQLPAAVPHFVGRAAELGALDALLDATGDGVVTAVLEGTAGVGKTTLAVHWAHAVAGRFPDGQLYVNLRGFDPAPETLSPAEVLHGVLASLGVPPERVPASVDGRISLYRSVLAGRRVLVLLDNARDADAVRTLLPGSPGCLVLVTSRYELTGLIAAVGAHPVALDVFTDAEARQLLAARLGGARVTGEPAAAATLIDLCARLPLALAITAARAAARPHLRLAELVGEFRDAGNDLDALGTGEEATDTRAALSWSYRQLPGPAARVFRLLGLCPGPDIALPAVASLAAVTTAEARHLLRDLTRAHLLAEPAPGRYAMHDLLRAYAAERARATDPDGTRRAAVGRLLDHYLHTALAAALLLSPARPAICVAPARPGVTPGTHPDHHAALRWFEAERPVLLAAAALAATSGFDVHAWQLPWSMADFLDRTGHWHDSVTVQRTGLARATSLGDVLAQAMAGRALGKAYAWLADYDRARAQLADSLRRYEQLGDRHGQARVHQSLMWVAEREARYADALDHAGQALTLFRAVAHRAGEAEALNAVGWCELLLGDPARARRSCQRALALSRESGNRRHEALTSDSLGRAEHMLGHFDRAAARYRHALRLFRDADDRFYQSEVLTHLGDTHQAAGDPSRARQSWQQALLLLDELHHPGAAELRARLRAHPDGTRRWPTRAGS